MSEQMAEAIKSLKQRINRVYDELDHLRWELNRIGEDAGQAPALPTDRDLVGGAVVEDQRADIRILSRQVA